MIARFRNLSLQIKMTAISLIANLFVFVINIVLLAGINIMSGRIDNVYQENMRLNELSVSLVNVQEAMTEYLNAKTSDSLEEYYRSAQVYSEQAEALSSDVTGSLPDRMEYAIRNMSAEYLSEVSETIEAKRGRNVEKYRSHYDEATKLYGYINTYIYSLNNEQFKENSENYREMISAFKTFEMSGNMILIAVIIVNALLIIRLTANLIRPLKLLAGRADEVGKGNFDVTPLTVESEDEVGVVTRAFNQMVVSIQNYIRQVRENAETERQLKEKELLMEAHLKDAQLKYLQSQINPHFLFNTLNAGAQLAMLEGADRTSEYVRVMAEFFRYNVKKGFQTVTVGEELELVDNYIYILNVRFSGDIIFEKEVDSSLLNVKMPSMILQPLVENCVNHGIRDMLGEGRIRLSVYPMDDYACIRIEDNGIGMSEDTIEKLLNGQQPDPDKKESNGIGMDNVIARLKLFSENDDVFDISSDGEGKGTRFTIYLKKGGDN